MARRCLSCGTDDEPMTRDHVVSRFVLKTTLSREEYEEFSRQTGKKLNKQPLCSHCNSEKGYSVIDFRGVDTARQLMDVLENEFGVTIEIEVQDNGFHE